MLTSQVIAILALTPERRVFAAFLSPVKRRISRESFHPSPMGILLNPYYLARSSLLRKIRIVAPRLRGDVLDVGCGTKPYVELFANAASYTGLEYDSVRSRALSAADAFYDGGTFPFADDSFDVVFTSQTLEHVFTPQGFLREVNRVLKPGGTLLLAVPFAWPEHEAPVDYGRYTSYGLSSLLSSQGFDVRATAKTRAGTAALGQLLIALVMDMCPSSPVVRQLVTALVAAPITVGSLLLGFGPRSRPMFLDLVVLARSLK